MGVKIVSELWKGSSLGGKSQVFVGFFLEWWEEMMA